MADDEVVRLQSEFKTQLVSSDDGNTNMVIGTESQKVTFDIRCDFILR